MQSFKLLTTHSMESSSIEAFFEFHETFGWLVGCFD